jgi:hypothetical protein
LEKYRPLHVQLIKAVYDPQPILSVLYFTFQALSGYFKPEYGSQSSSQMDERNGAVECVIIGDSL